MNRGKWYLVYTYRSSLDGGLGGTMEDAEVPLKATIEDEAVTEAREIWETAIVEAHARWEIQKKEFAHPPRSPFENGPQTPRVIYKIPLGG